MKSTSRKETIVKATLTTSVIRFAALAAAAALLAAFVGNGNWH
jgi:hypothetical protein